MSELRRNPITGEWVTFAVKRGARPYDFVKKSEAKRIVAKLVLSVLETRMKPQKKYFKMMIKIGQ